jgi:hypothetical protein
MISLPPTLDAPLPPDKFHGRERIVQQICERLLNPERLSTSVVGGPRTGKTSLLRYLASPYSDARLPGLPYRVYLDAQLLSSTSGPADFWIRVLDDLRTGAQLEQEFVPALDRYLQNARGGTVADYDLETAIRAFSHKGQTIVAFVDDWKPSRPS